MSRPWTVTVPSSRDLSRPSVRTTLKSSVISRSKSSTSTDDARSSSMLSRNARMLSRACMPRPSMRGRERSSLGDIYEREVLHEAARVHLADRGPEVLADPLRRCERVSREIDHRGAGTAELDAVAAYRFRYRLRRGVDRVRVPAVGVTLGDAVEREQAGAGEDLGGGVRSPRRRRPRPGLPTCRRGR